ncbi:MAG: right-handed parallel beta-helix repeat-containing protein [Anaerolineae bacterium]
MKTKHLLISFVLGLGLITALLWALNEATPSAARAATANTITVCLPTDGPCDYTNVQAAVDAAGEGDVIKVAAGTYAGVSSRAGTTQAVYISKTVTIRGGYTTTNGFADPPDPVANPTTLDAQWQGRVFYVAEGADPTLDGLRITGGATTNSGGGVYVASATLTISGSIVTSNTAGLVGGGLYLHASEATLTGNAILSNTAGASGGGMLLWASSAAIEGNVIAGNAALGESASWAGGGGVYLHGGSTAALVNNAIVDNQVANQGGGLYVDGSSAFLMYTTIARNGCTASVDGRGSGVYLGQGVSPTLVVMTNTILTNHGTGLETETGTTAQLNGVLWYDNTTANTAGLGTITVTHAITGTPAFATGDTHLYHLTAGSAAIDQGVITEVAVDIDGDTRPMDGDVDGAAVADLGADEYWACRVRLNDDITDYMTVQAAVDASTHPADVVKVGGYCAGVEARTGATQTVYISKTLTIQGGYATYDFAIPPDPAANPTTLDAQQQGRVFYIAEGASPTLQGLRITGGVADGGGGVCVVSATLTISGSIVYSNTAGLVGGGLYLHASEATLTGNAILSNTAGASGGGMLLWASSAAIEGNVIAGNAANGQDSEWAGGGGVYLHGGSDAALVNNAIVDNQVANQGGGLYVDGSVAHMLHTTIARNGCTSSVDGRGSGVYLGQGVSPTLIVMTNTILTNHGTGLETETGTTAQLNGVLWYDNTTANTAGLGTITVTHAITGTPAFATGDTHLYHLTAGSAAIDQGVITEVAVDIDGDTRPMRLLPDLGADEAPIWYHFPLAMRQAP